MAIVKQKDKKTGTIYVYEQTSTWIPELKQPRSHRKLIGKIDPETGEMVPTGSVGRPKTKNTEDGTSEADGLQKELNAAQKKTADLSERIRQLEATVKAQETEIRILKSRISKAAAILQQQ